MARGAPDYERIVTVDAEVEMGTGARDWERIVVGPEGVPISGGGASGLAPPDLGFLGWTNDLTLIGDSTSSFSGAVVVRMWLGLVKISAAGTVNNVWFAAASADGWISTELQAVIYGPVPWNGTTTPALAASSSTSGGTIATSKGLVFEVPLSAGLAVTEGQLYWVGVVGEPGTPHLQFYNPPFVAVASTSGQAVAGLWNATFPAPANADLLVTDAAATFTVWAAVSS